MAQLPNWDIDPGGSLVNLSGLSGQLAHWSAGTTSEAKVEQNIAVSGGIPCITKKVSIF